MDTVEIILRDGSTRTADVIEYQPTEPSNYVWAPFWVLAYTDAPEQDSPWLDTSGDVFQRDEDGSDDYIGVVAEIAIADHKRQLEEDAMYEAWEREERRQDCEICARMRPSEKCHLHRKD